MMTSSTTPRSLLSEEGAAPSAGGPIEAGGGPETCILAALRAAEMASPPSCVAVREESEPSRPPIGVRTAPMMQTSEIECVWVGMVGWGGGVSRGGKKGEMSFFRGGLVRVEFWFLISFLVDDEKRGSSFTALFLHLFEHDSQTRALRQKIHSRLLLTDERRVV